MLLARGPGLRAIPLRRRAKARARARAGDLADITLSIFQYGLFNNCLGEMSEQKG